MRSLNRLRGLQLRLWCPPTARLVMGPRGEELRQSDKGYSQAVELLRKRQMNDQVVQAVLLCLGVSWLGSV